MTQCLEGKIMESIKKRSKPTFSITVETSSESKKQKFFPVLRNIFSLDINHYTLRLLVLLIEKSFNGKLKIEEKKLMTLVGLNQQRSLQNQLKKLEDTQIITIVKLKKSLEIEIPSYQNLGFGKIKGFWFRVPCGLAEKETWQKNPVTLTLLLYITSQVYRSKSGQEFAVSRREINRSLGIASRHISHSLKKLEHMDFIKCVYKSRICSKRSVYALRYFSKSIN